MWHTPKTCIPYVSAGKSLLLTKKTIMKLKNARNKLEKAGFAVRIKPWSCYKAEREFGKYVIEFQADCDGDVSHFSVRRKDDLPDMQSDYFPYFFFDTCKRAIEFASR